MNHLLLIGLSVLLSYGVVEAKIEVGDGPDGNVTAEEIWADQKNKHKPGDTWPKSDGCNTCEMDQYGTSYCTTLYCRGKNLEFENEPLPRELVTCDQDMTKCETPCEREMKEVMREVGEILKFNHGSLNSRKPGEARICFNLSPILYQWWSNVMKECVQ